MIIRNGFIFRQILTLAANRMYGHTVETLMEACYTLQQLLYPLLQPSLAACKLHA